VFYLYGFYDAANAYLLIDHSHPDELRTVIRRLEDASSGVWNVQCDYMLGKDFLYII
jgi:hypothetical protein